MQEKKIIKYQNTQMWVLDKPHALSGPWFAIHKSVVSKISSNSDVTRCGHIKASLSP